MATIRSKKTVITGSSVDNPMKPYAESFAKLAKDVITECTYDVFSEPHKVLMSRGGRELMKDFFIKESYDPQEFAGDPGKLQEFKEDMALQFENDSEGLLENTVTSDMNPIIGMGPIMHKYILMNNVYDKGAIQKMVTDDQKITLTHQYRYIITPSGEKIDFFRQQNEISRAMSSTNPIKIIELNLPELGTTDIVEKLNGTTQDRLSVATYVMAVKIPNVYFEVGDPLPDEKGYYCPTNTEKAVTAESKDVWFRQDIQLAAGYSNANSYGRSAMKEVRVTVKVNDSGTVKEEEIIDTIAVAIDDQDRVTANSIRSKITGIRLYTRLDSSNAMLETVQPIWEEKTIIDQVPDAQNPINITLSPDELKDIASLYKIDQLAEKMEMIKIMLVNDKDQKIKDKLDYSYDNLDPAFKSFGKFDYAPRQGYADTHVSWIRDTFYFYFDSFITKLYQMYNDPNLTVTIFGDPDLVRKATPTTIVYDSPASIGPVDLDFFKKVSTSDKRVYQWIGSDKERGNTEFTIILTPTGNNKRVTYRIIDYMFYISNEIKNAKNPLLPSVHAYERWLWQEYEPVQARLEILNPSGLRPEDLPDMTRTRKSTYNDAL